MYKLNLRTVHDKFSQLEIDVMFEANKVGEDQYVEWPPFLNILIKRIREAGFVKLTSPPSGGVFAGGMQINPMHLKITQNGKDYIQKMSEEEMWTVQFWLICAEFGLEPKIDAIGSQKTNELACLSIVNRYAD